MNLSIRHADTFQKFLVLSALIHASVFLVYGLKVLVFPNQIIMIPDAIRVDVIDLPDKLTNTKPVTEEKKQEVKAKPPEPKPTPKEVPKEKPKVDTKADQKRAFEKLQQLSALDKIKQEVKNNSKAESAEPLKPNLPVFKGNQITSGNSFTGLSGIRSQEYWDQVKMHLQAYWMLPEWLANARLKASVVVMIDSDGRVIRHEIYSTSGNSTFDDAALAAVEAASPFPVPPAQIRDTISSSWMIFNFPE